jgi:hypothetical protein
MNALLRGGPGDNHTTHAPRPDLVWRACLYQRTTDTAHHHGQEVRVYAHRPDCCDWPNSRGDTDGCE